MIFDGCQWTIRQFGSVGIPGGRVGHEESIALFIRLTLRDSLGDSDIESAVSLIAYVYPIQGFLA